MRSLAWIGVGWLGLLLCSALGARLQVAHVLPDVPLLVVIFLSMRRGPLMVAATGLALGFLAGQQALAPVGLHETALTLCGVGMVVAAGNIAAGGSAFYGMAVAVAALGHQLLLASLVYWERGSVGFSSWATALLLPGALCTAGVGLLLHPLLLALERRLTSDTREGLLWR